MMYHVLEVVSFYRARFQLLSCLTQFQWAKNAIGLGQCQHHVALIKCIFINMTPTVFGY